MSAQPSYNHQRGAILVLSAFLLPLIIGFTGLAIDVGNLYLHHSYLQNSTDAAALAGGHKYAEKSNQSDTKSTITAYLDTNKFNQTSYSLDSISFRAASSSDTRITVQASEVVPLYFLKYFISEPKTITAKSTAQVTKVSSTIPPIFSYAMLGGYTAKPLGNPGKETEHTDSIYLKSSKINITGKVHANGPIYLPDNHFTSVESLTCTAYTDGDLWSNYRDNYWEHYANSQDGQWGKPTVIAAGHENDEKISGPFGANQDTNWRYYYRIATATGGDYVASQIHQDAIDISLSSTNNMTSALYTQIEKYRKMSLSEREALKVYVDTNGNYSSSTAASNYTSYSLTPSSDTSIYPGLTCGSFKTTHPSSESWKVWNDVYKTVIVDGNIEQANIPSGVKPADANDHLLLVSLHGDITLPISSPLYGFVYAPNGTVWVDGNQPIYGSIVAKHIKITTGEQQIKAVNTTFDSGSSSSSSSFIVTLVSDE